MHRAGSSPVVSGTGCILCTLTGGTFRTERARPICFPCDWRTGVATFLLRGGRDGRRVDQKPWKVDYFPSVAVPVA